MNEWHWIFSNKVNNWVCFCSRKNDATGITFQYILFRNFPCCHFLLYIRYQFNYILGTLNMIMVRQNRFEIEISKWKNRWMVDLIHALCYQYTFVGFLEIIIESEFKMKNPKTFITVTLKKLSSSWHCKSTKSE